MTKEEIIKELETRSKEYVNFDELNFVDFLVEFFKKRKKTPQEEINKGLKSYIENYNNIVLRTRFESKYGKLILMRDNPNWKDELKEEYTQNLKKFLILFVVPVFSLLLGFSFIMDEIFLFLKNKKEFTSIINVYYFQLLMLYIIIPIIIYNPLNMKLYLTKEQRNFSIYSLILRRYVLGGNLLFLSSLISIIFKFYGFGLTNNLTWGDIKCIIIPFCIGFVFFYNSFLKNKTNE
jgi:hypothetical protein